MARTAEERARDEQRVELALLGKLVPAHDQRRHTKVVGVMHRNEDGSSRQEAIERMIQFDHVQLERNPDDAHDRNAIRVLVQLKGKPEPVQIGHLERELAAELAPAIDAGTRWEAIATRVGGPYSKGVSLMLYRTV